MIPLAPDRTWVECSWYMPDRTRAATGRPVVRRGVLGHHQQAGLVGVRVGAAWSVVAALQPRAVQPERGRRAPVRDDDRPGVPRPPHPRTRRQPLTARPPRIAGRTSVRGTADRRSARNPGLRRRCRGGSRRRARGPRRSSSTRATCRGSRTPRPSSASGTPGAAGSGEPARRRRGTSPRSAVQSTVYVGSSRDVDRQPHRLEVLGHRRVTERVQAHPDRRRPPRLTASPNTSITQISAECSGRSSSPTIQNATIDRGVITPRARISMQPPDRRPAPELLLRLAHGEPFPVRLLADRAADRPGEVPGLDPGGAHGRAVVARAPQPLVRAGC